MLSNLKAEVGVGASAIGLGVAGNLLGRHIGFLYKDLGPAALQRNFRDRQWLTASAHAPGSAGAITFSETSRNFAVATPETEG